MSVFISILMTVLILNVIVVVHEFGHYITAKKFGVGIKEFSIGMGPVIYQKQKKEHRFVFFRKKKMFPEDEFKFSIRALPIGGFVNLKGEEETSEDPDSFSKLKPWKKLVVFLAGAFMNMVLGVVCIAIIGTFFIDVDITTKVADFGSVTISEDNVVEPMSPADGLMVGDEIYKINGHRTYDITDIQYELGLANADSVDIIVKRDGEFVTLEDVHFPTNVVDGMTTMMMDFRVEAEAKTFVGTLKYIGNTILALIKMVYRSLWGLITGKFPLSAMSGIVGVTAAVSESASAVTSISDFAYYFLYLTALLTINIGLFNVLPIPALDGGQSCLCIFEMITKKKIPAKVHQIVNTVFLFALLALMALITVKDVVGLFK